MRFSPSIETQLTAAANAADRANRPRIFVVAPAILLIGALILTLIVFQRFSVAKGVLSSRLVERGQVEALIDYARRLEEAHPDPARLFPVNDFMDANINDVAKEIWGEGGPVAVTGKTKKNLGINLNKQIIRAEVEVSFSTAVSIEDIFRFTHEVLATEELEGVFLARVDLHPLAGGGGWVGSLKFSLYERAR